jgi:hypothetical protein
LGIFNVTVSYDVSKTAWHEVTQCAQQFAQDINLNLTAFIHTLQQLVITAEVSACDVDVRCVAAKVCNKVVVEYLC